MSDCAQRLLYGRKQGWQGKVMIKAMNALSCHFSYSGSEFKIDASYLSPNVNMASRLEAATKQFGVSLLLSGDFVDLLSPWVQQRVRQIDCVTVKGSDR